jgi:hypothetical protein
MPATLRRPSWMLTLMHAMQNVVDAAAGQYLLSAQQSIQLHLLSIAFSSCTEHDTASTEDKRSTAVLDFAECLWEYVDQTAQGSMASAHSSRFAAHLGLALVALGVVPRNSGLLHHR